MWVGVAFTVVLVLLVVVAVRWWLGFKRQPDSITKQPFVVEPGAFDSLARQLYPTTLTQLPHGSLLPELRAIDDQVDTPSESLAPGAAGTTTLRQDIHDALAADAVAAAQSAYEWLSIDPHVFEAVSQMSHEHVDSFWSLSEVVSERHYQLAQAAFQRSLSGHIAEFHVRDDLLTGANHVTMPETSNFPGIDMWVNGSPVNVKNVVNVPSTASQHFANHPDVSMVVPGDVPAPDSALNFSPGDHLDPSSLAEHHQVLVDAGLSHAETVSEAASASHLLLNHGVDTHGIPIVTLILSSRREFKLWQQHQTTVVRAGINVTVDAAGMGVGAMAGLKTGAAAGTALGPGHGNVVGGILGAAAGGITGKLTAAQARRAPLRLAQIRLNDAVNAVAARQVEVEASIAKEWETSRDAVQVKWEQVLAEAQGAQDKQLAQIRYRLDSVRVIATRQDANELLRLATTAADRFVAHAPKRKQLALQRAHAVWAEQLDAVIGRFAATTDWATEFYDVLAAAPGMRAQLEGRISSVAAARGAAFSAAAEVEAKLASDLAAGRAAAIGRLEDAFARLAEKCQQLMSGVLDELASATEAHASELRKAGLLPAPE